MDNRRDLVTVFLKAENEQQLQAKLFELSLETTKANDIITIYPKGSSVVAWVRVDKKYIELASSAPKKEEVKSQVKKKKTKKKAVKE